jgi:hypothetical protein
MAPPPRPVPSAEQGAGDLVEQGGVEGVLAAEPEQRGPQRFGWRAIDGVECRRCSTRFSGRAVWRWCPAPGCTRTEAAPSRLNGVVSLEDQRRSEVGFELRYCLKSVDRDSF